MKLTTSIILLLITTGSYCQPVSVKITGTYSDEITKLELKTDSSFVLSTPDYVYPTTYKYYTSSGKWTFIGNQVILNPGKIKRVPTLSMTEKIVGNADSIQIKINYQNEIYENDVLITKERTSPELMTLYLNNSKKYINLVHSPRLRICWFARKVKRQYIIDSSSIVKLPLQKLKTIGIYTYGFDTTLQLISRNEKANYFEITIVQPIDKERMPRNKEVIVQGKNAFFYEYEGKVVTKGWLDPLKKGE